MWASNFNPRSREGSDWFHTSNPTHITIFQSTLPRRERLYLISPAASRTRFQSTLPRRERRVQSQYSSEFSKFQSTLPRRERHIPTVLPIPYNTISIHAPAKGATNPSPSCVASTNNFNPRSREGSDHRLANFGKSSHISIHAPAKGATPHGLAVCNLLAIFQSTLPRRERLFNSVCIIQLNIFQSTLPRRERRSWGMPFVPFIIISIHAPAKGATSWSIFPTLYAKISIHAPAKGATNSSWLLSPFPIYFNPRSREGSDAPVGEDERSIAISIHAPAKGATWLVIMVLIVVVYFNPRSREGSDWYAGRVRRVPSYFNPRSREGSDVQDVLTGKE